MNDRQTSDLVRRSGDARISRRVPVLASSGESVDAKRARAEKYFCPGCGQVRRPDSVFEALASRQVYKPVIVGDKIMPHEFYTSTDALEYCPGGTFDRVADAA